MGYVLALFVFDYSIIFEFPNHCLCWCEAGARPKFAGCCPPTRSEGWLYHCNQVIHEEESIYPKQIVRKSLLCFIASSNRARTIRGIRPTQTHTPIPS